MKKFNEIVYERPDFDEFIEYVKKATEEFKNADANRQVELIKELDYNNNKVGTMSQLASIRYTIDTRDEFYKKEMDFIDEVDPKIEEVVTAFKHEVLHSKYREELEKVFGKHLFVLYEMQEKTFDPSIMDDLVEEAKTTKEYSKLIGSAQIEFDGQTYTLSRLSPLMQSNDRQTRKRASEAYTSFFEEHLEEFDDIYDRLVHIRDRIAKKLGFKNFIELGYLRMSRSDYGPEEVKKYRDAIIKYVVPYKNTIIERQKKRLGLDGFYYYDEVLKFNSGNPTPKGGPEWMLEKGKEVYKRLGPVTDEFFTLMTDCNSFDLLSRDGKMSGGYCTILKDYKLPFIFANMNGTSHDAEVLTHEAGHAIQMYLSRNQVPAEYGFPTYEACEIHSMSMEFLTYPHIDLFFEEDTEKFKYAHMAGTMEFLPYGALIDHFQHYVYENVDASPEERRKKFRELEKIYLPHKDYEDNQFLENGGFWFRQGHIFEVPFYYIDYTLAQVCAIGFFKKSLENHEKAMEEYLALCELGGSKSFLGLVESAGLENPFIETTMKEAVETIKSQLDVIDDSKF